MKLHRTNKCSQHGPQAQCHHTKETVLNTLNQRLDKDSTEKDLGALASSLQKASPGAARFVELPVAGGNVIANWRKADFSAVAMTLAIRTVIRIIINYES